MKILLGVLGAAIMFCLCYPSVSRSGNEFPVDYIDHNYEAAHIFGVSRETSQNRLNKVTNADSIRRGHEFTTTSDDRFYIARLLASLEAGEPTVGCAEISEVIWVVDLIDGSEVVTYFSDGLLVSGPGGCRSAKGLKSLDVLDWLGGGSESEGLDQSP
jgi:hypothetical protein